MIHHLSREEADAHLHRTISLRHPELVSGSIQAAISSGKTTIMKHGYVYIMTNQPYGTLYVGVTSDMIRRDYEHKHGSYQGFTKKYGLKLLVYLETFESVEAAITREKQLKHWHRDWKINLINEHNPEWKNIELVESSLLNFGSGYSGADALWMGAETRSA